MQTTNSNKQVSTLIPCLIDYILKWSSAHISLNKMCDRSECHLFPLPVLNATCGLALHCYWTHCSEQLGGGGAGQAWSFWLCRLLCCLILLQYTWVTFVVYKEQLRVVNQAKLISDYVCIYCMYAYVWVCTHMCAPTCEGRGMLTSSTAFPLCFLSQRLSLSLELADWLDWLPHKP